MHVRFPSLCSIDNKISVLIGPVVSEKKPVKIC